MLDKRDAFAEKMKNFTTLSSRKFKQQLMACLISFLQHVYVPEISHELKKYFYKKNSNGHGNSFKRQNLGYGEKRVPVLATLFVAVVEQCKKSEIFHLKVKKQPKCLVLKMQLPIC